MRTLHLFAGAGGGLLADLILGHQPVAAVECDAYCCEVLRERAADGWWPDLRVHQQDVRLFDPPRYAGRVDCVAAGFPCQPFSLAGKQRGAADERDMWPATLAVIRALRPRFVFLENVPGIVAWNRGERVADIIGSLAAMGYLGSSAVLGADAAGAPHRRQRWWLLADSGIDASVRPCMYCGYEFDHDLLGKYGCANCCGEGLDDTDTERERLERKQQTGTEAWPADRPGDGCDTGWWQVEPDVGRVVDELAHRVDRLKAIGNGQVPLQAALAWRILEQRLA